jgi:hypothetical protein
MKKIFVLFLIFLVLNAALIECQRGRGRGGISRGRGGISRGRGGFSRGRGGFSRGRGIYGLRGRGFYGIRGRGYFGRGFYGRSFPSLRRSRACPPVICPWLYGLI